MIFIKFNKKLFLKIFYIYVGTKRAFEMIFVKFNKKIFLKIISKN